MEDHTQITETLIQGDDEKLIILVQEALDSGANPGKLLNHVLIPAMDVIGERMESGEMFIPEVLMGARAMGLAVEMLKPLLGDGESSSAGKVIIGTVKGDLHDIGKNLVSMMMESAGFEVTDLGVDIAPENFIAAIKDQNATIVALSALLTTTMPMMKATVEAICESGLREQVKIIVGGAPVNQSFADEIGADGYAADAGSASKLAKSYLN
ncbi:MAG: corrinoid protein [Desulfobacterium sp.]|nr:corrinoid protein [Desulfobacterium sp.]